MSPHRSALATLRAELETVDARLIAVVAERQALAREIGRVKAAAGLPVVDPAREAMIVTRASAGARDAGLPEDDVRALYWNLLAMSRRAQLDARPSAS